MSRTPAADCRSGHNVFKANPCRDEPMQSGGGGATDDFALTDLHGGHGKSLEKQVTLRLTYSNKNTFSALNSCYSI